ncbi:MAG: hypothetical protein ACLVAU_10890 [Ruminococcus sp.]
MTSIKMWVRDENGAKDNTMLNYMYMYEMFVDPYIGKARFQDCCIRTLRAFTICFTENAG